MENASNALIIAGSVLIGILILSSGVLLITSFGQSSRDINQQISDSQIAAFNKEFTKYLNQDKIKAHDIVSVSNLARQNNRNVQKFDQILVKGDSPYYISVSVKKSASVTDDAFETGGTGTNDTNENHEKKMIQFMKDFDIKSGTIEPYYFKCVEVKINSKTRMVERIKFEII